MPWKLPSISSKQDMKTAIQGKKWLSVFINEPQAICCHGPQYQYLIHGTHTIICATATPLHMGLGDLVNMAHLFHLPALCSDTGFNLAVTHQRKIDHLHTSIPKDEVKWQAEAAMSGSDPLHSPQLDKWKAEAQGFVKKITSHFD
jgi:hypothetical protein